ncbi:MAG: alpha/beta hydrolase [Chitinophagales bacterium]
MKLNNILFVFLWCSIFCISCGNNKAKQAQNSTHINKTSENISKSRAVSETKKAKTADLSLTYLVRKPAATSHKKAPLLLLLHGYGSNAKSMFQFSKVLDERFLILSVQAPMQLDADGHKWYSIDFVEKNIVRNDDDIQKSCGELRIFIENLGEQFEFDKNEIYLMGFSQGAIMSLEMALTQNEHTPKIAGTVAMSGRIDDKLMQRLTTDKEILKQLSIFVTHGTADDVIGIEEARNAKKILEQLPVNLQYQEYENMPHTVSNACLKDIQTWLTKQINR